MKQIYILALAFMVLLSMTMSVEALEQKTIYRQNGMAAYADWMETTPEGLTTDTSLSVTQSNDGIDIYISMCSYDTEGNWSCKSGYEFAQDDVFSIDKKLNSANLEVVNIDLYQWNCDETGMCWVTPDGNVTIGANWAGNGEISKSSSKYTSKSGDISIKYSDSSSIREATVTGSLDGLELGPSSYGGLVIFKSASISMQK